MLFYILCNTYSYNQHINMTVEEKLKEYRRKKHKGEITESIKATIENVIPWNRNCETKKLVEESTKKEEVLYQLLSGCFAFIDTICILMKFNTILIDMTNILGILCLDIHVQTLFEFYFGFLYAYFSNITFIICNLFGQKVQIYKDSPDIQDDLDTCLENNIQKPKSTIITIVIYILYFMLWVTLYIIAVEYEFGAVYFILSTLIFIWLNTRSEPKQQGEPSAYSVFNPNCEAIEGTLDASQFEREIRYGIGST